MTWREWIKGAAKGVETAREARDHAFREAHDAGLSYRQIAEAAGCSAATVHRAIGGHGGSARDDALLDTDVVPAPS